MLKNDKLNIRTDWRDPLTNTSFSSLAAFLAITIHGIDVYPVLVFTTLLCVIFQIDIVQQWVIWDKSAIFDGELWRILTGNFSHTNISHLLMNLAALSGICFLFSPNRNQLITALLLISSATGIALLATDIELYVGLSGTLHGLFALFALKEAIEGRKSSWVLVAGVIVKVGWEQLYGASATTSSMIDARVAIEAHLAGTLAGIALALPCAYRKAQSIPAKD